MSSIIALSKLYTLNDDRLAQIMVKGDLIMPTSDRIMTRSRARASKQGLFHLLPTYAGSIGQSVFSYGSFDYRLYKEHLAHTNGKDPETYTSIPVPLKIIKVLIVELASASGENNAFAAAAAAEALEDEGEDDGDWEDEPSGTLDLTSPAMRENLMAYGEGEGFSSRQGDDETQAYLVNFFGEVSRDQNLRFQEVFATLTPAEQTKLHQLGQV
jgi:importin-9